MSEPETVALNVPDADTSVHPNLLVQHLDLDRSFMPR